MVARDAEKLSRNRGKAPFTLRSCLTCRAFKSTEFEVLPESDVRVLDRAKVTRVYEPGEAVFHEGTPSEGIYCVGAGVVCARRIDASGRSVPLRLKYPGDTLGLRAFLFSDPHPSTLEALETSRVCVVDANTVRKLLSRNMNLALAFIRRLGKDLSVVEEKLVNRANVNARVRLARLFVNFVEFHGIVSKDDVLVFKLPITRKEMAEVLGVTLRTISSHLRTLRRNGIVEVDGRNVEVHDFSRLIVEAGLKTADSSSL